MKYFRISVVIFLVTIILGATAHAFDLTVVNNTEYTYSFNLFCVDPSGVKEDRTMWGGGVSPGEAMSSSFNWPGTLFRIEWIFLHNNDNEGAPESAEFQCGSGFVSKNEHDSFISEPTRELKQIIRRTIKL